MSVEQMLPLTHPIMRAWRKFQQTPAYMQAERQAPDARHVAGALWLAFYDAWNRRAPTTEETRLRAEVVSLRAALGQQPAAEGAEPVGCPIPGMCAAVAAHACAARKAAEAMREAAAGVASNFRPWSKGGDIGGSEAHHIAAAIRALPLPAAPEGEEK